MNLSWRSALLAAFCLAAGFVGTAVQAEEKSAGDGSPRWRPAGTAGVPRPHFEQLRDPATGEPILAIRADSQPGQFGSWQAEFPVQGGQWYRFSVLRRVENISHPRRSAVVQLWWYTASGRKAPRPGVKAQPDFPGEGKLLGNQWREVAGVFQAPPEAARVVVNLQLRWAPGGKVLWKRPRWEAAQPPPPRKVRLAAVHFTPPGKTPRQNLESLVPLLEKAAKQRADLVCLGECVTYVRTGKSYAQVAEPVPGPSTRFLGQYARKHNFYIVVGLVERDGQAIYNTAALIGPDGKLVGKYRKLALPTGEIDGGLVPGEEYPVFQTRFGKVGMMICWDVHFPEVARGLANRGAEIIAMPIWGGDPRLAQARAIENQIYLLTSTYNTRPRWMVSGVWGPSGDLLVQAREWGTVVVAEVDLSRRYYHFGFGPFRDRILRERPVWVPDQ